MLGILVLGCRWRAPAQAHHRSTLHIALTTTNTNRHVSTHHPPNHASLSGQAKPPLPPTVHSGLTLHRHTSQAQHPA
jgi:hypothetical protein